MNHQNRNPKRAIAKLLIAALGFTQILPPAYAASTEISDIPMAVKSSVPPNIMFMIDNSGSMHNIVPDTPFDPGTTYLASCPAANTVGGGVAGPGLPIDVDRIDIRIESGVPKMRRGAGGTGPSNLSSGTSSDYGTGSGKRCFDPTLRYNVRLYGDSCSGSICSPLGYLDAVYEGNYLNWYFGNASTGYATELNYGSGAIRNKPGTFRRLDVTKVAAQSVLDSLNNVRVGLSSYNSNTSGDWGELLEVMGDISTSRTRMKAKVDAIPPSGNTPLAETLSDIGRYFGTGSSTVTLRHGQKDANDVSLATSANTSTVFSHSIRNNTTIGGYSSQSIVAPIQYFCQKSFTVLMTDGRPQGDQGITGPLADYDGDCTGANASNCFASPSHDRKLSRAYESQGSDYLDDIAQGLFEMDLRPDLVKPANSLVKRNNLLTYPISFAEIQLIGDPLLGDTADKGQGTPDGLALEATNASTLVTAFQAAADDILGKDRGASAVAVANANVSSEDGDNLSFASSYNAGSWTGDLQAFPINLTNGQPDAYQPTWMTGCSDPNAKVDLSDPNSPPKGCSAQEQLTQRTSPRLIATYSGSSGTGQGLQFRAFGATGAGIVTTLTSAQHALLNTPVSPPGTSDGAAVIAYLRGNRSGEVATYRSRNRLLGDVVNSEPVIVNKPKANYSDAGYSAFRTQWGTTTPRTRMVYQGANDGMLHAFNASTGAEEWAYIPNLVIPGLNNLSRRNGFAHKFYVDGTPVSGDVDFNNIGIGGTGASDWRTILVGGLGKGGRGFYALDVTDPIASDEAAVAGKVLWEFPNSATSAATTANIGYSYGKPVIVKTQNYGWVVLVTSGYNNGSDSGGNGQGYLFVLDAKTGALVQEISTGVGTASDPGGLAYLSAYVENTDVNNITTMVYGGDLKGNVWRFNLAGDKTTWSKSQLALLKDPIGNPQPVTTVPELAKIKISGTDKRFVFVGTGLYLGETDVPGHPSQNAHATQTQTMYGLVDDGSTTINDRAMLQAQTISENTDKQRTYSQNAVDFLTRKGWYIDLPVTGERSVTDPQLALGALVFTSNIPSSAPCVPGGTSYLNVVDYKTGGNIEVRDANGVLIPSGSYLGDALASRGVLIKLPDVSGQSGQVKALIRRSDGTTTVANVPIPPGVLGGKRVSWREIPDR